jgi:hypothetical protein
MVADDSSAATGLGGVAGLMAMVIPSGTIWLKR